VIVIRKLLQSSAIVRNGVNAGIASLECARTAFGGKHTNRNAIDHFVVEQESATIKLINKTSSMTDYIRISDFAKSL